MRHAPYRHLLARLVAVVSVAIREGRRGDPLISIDTLASVPRWCHVLNPTVKVYVARADRAVCEGRKRSGEPVRTAEGGPLRRSCDRRSGVSIYTFAGRKDALRNHRPGYHNLWPDRDGRNHLRLSHELGNGHVVWRYLYTFHTSTYFLVHLSCVECWGPVLYLCVMTKVRRAVVGRGVAGVVAQTRAQRV